MEAQTQKSIFNPKHHLLNPQKFQKQTCIICTQQSISLIRCKTCKNCLCNQCAIDQKLEQNRCPFRCTKGQLELELITDMNMEFGCPFSEKCQRKIGDMKQFYQHDRFCQFISEQQKKIVNKKWQHKCSNNHSLQIYLQVFENLIKRRKCSSCGQVNPTRSICQKCDQFYCRYCRPLPIYQLKCPNQHQFCKRDISSIYYRCDICELSPTMLGIEMYDDFMCNFGICQICMKTWPQFQHPVQYCQNLPYHCEVAGQSSIKHLKQYQKIKQKHKLIYLKQQIIKKCSWCDKIKQCYKMCQKCDTFYCYSCKIFDVLQTDQCILGHKLQLIVQKQSVQEDKKIQCYRCHKNDKHLYKDFTCNVVLCVNCLQEQKKYNFDLMYKQISLNNKLCPFGNGKHLNFFLPYRKDIEYICTLCQKYKKIKMTCGMCKQPKYYCCACIPPQNSKLCYCLAQLKKTEGLNQDYCYVCDQLHEGEIYGCWPCGYTICEGCMKSTFYDVKIQTQTEEIQMVSNNQESI